MIVCLCNNISDHQIRHALESGLSTMAELRRDLGVATGCGHCADYAGQLLAAHLRSKIPAPELSERSVLAESTKKSPLSEESGLF